MPCSKLRVSEGFHTHLLLSKAFCLVSIWGLLRQRHQILLLAVQKSKKLLSRNFSSLNLRNTTVTWLPWLLPDSVSGFLCSSFLPACSPTSRSSAVAAPPPATQQIQDSFNLSFNLKTKISELTESPETATVGSSNCNYLMQYL